MCSYKGNLNILNYTDNNECFWWGIFTSSVTVCYIYTIQGVLCLFRHKISFILHPNNVLAAYDQSTVDPKVTSGFPLPYASFAYDEKKSASCEKNQIEQF